jgi:DNA-binding Lrp family transcriptional regulator
MAGHERREGCRMMTAIVFVNVERGTVNTVADTLAGMPEVSEVYSVGGRYDLIAIVRVNGNEDLATVVTDRMGKIAAIKSTETMIAFRAYSRHDLESMFSIGAQ